MFRLRASFAKLKKIGARVLRHDPKLAELPNPAQVGHLRHNARNEIKDSRVSSTNSLT